MATNARTMPRIRDNDWTGLRRALNTLSKLSLGPEATPTFAGLTVNSLTASGTIQGGTLTDGVLSINSGSITDAINLTASGTVQAGQLISTGNILIADNGFIGSFSKPEVIHILGSGNVNFPNSSVVVAGNITSEIGTLFLGTKEEERTDAQIRFLSKESDFRIEWSTGEIRDDDTLYLWGEDVEQWNLKLATDSESMNIIVDGDSSTLTMQDFDVVIEEDTELGGDLTLTGGDIDVTGKIAAGLTRTASGAFTIIKGDLILDHSGTVPEQQFGMEGAISLNNTNGATYQSRLAGIIGTMTINDTSGGGSFTDVIGVSSSVQGSTNSGHIDNVYGILATITAFTFSGSIDCVAGIQINQQVLTVAGAITDNIGLNISDISGATNNYAIKTGAGVVSLGDETHIGNGTDETVISATGSITQGGSADATLNLTTSSTQTNWDVAYDNMVTDIAFNTGDGILTVTQQDSGTLTTDSLDGRYYTETELGSISNGVGASLIGIEDAMALYAGTDVEAALEEVMDMITIETHVADSFEVGGDQVGTITGIVENTQVINDGDEFILNETTGGPNPNFVQTFEFSGITAGHEPNLIELHWYYSPVTTPHTISIQMYNYNTSTWDVIDNTTLTATGGTLTFSTFTIIDGGSAIVDYTSGGAARVRFSHDDNGIAAHDFGIDYLAIKDDHGIGSGITDHGSLSGLQDDDHDPLYHTDGRAATWLAANHETTFTHANIATNTSKVTNATHIGEVTGSGALTAQSVMITGKDAATVASGDLILVSDINDSNILKKVTAQSIGDLGGGDGDKNADGGFANSTYTAPQSIDGGNA